MKHLLLLPLALLAFALAACEGEEAAPLADEEATALPPEGAFVAVGDEIPLEGVALDLAALAEDPGAYAGERVRVAGTVNKVCQMRGCWLTLENPVGDPVRVLVPKDEEGNYAYTFPTDLGPQRVVLEGVARVETLDVETQRHLAEDEGRSQAEIDAITEPQEEVVLVAAGALIQRPAPPAAP
ncbi:MAG: DUF4920 domain-containing protein [Rhodothermales bacterium]|nr:DUF4920 domain-containing protein [Rhodothermales bacterium]